MIQMPRRRESPGPTPHAPRRTRRTPTIPGAGTRPRKRTGRETPDAPHGRVLCRACRSPVTSEASLVAVAGQSVHHRTNPAGVAFTFGCFGDAPGALPVGEATPLHTWFPGYAWRLAHCGACGVHLGWRFDGNGPGFYGLALDRLASDGAGEGP